MRKTIVSRMLAGVFVASILATASASAMADRYGNGYRDGYRGGYSGGLTDRQVVGAVLIGATINALSQPQVIYQAAPQVVYQPAPVYVAPVREPEPVYEAADVYNPYCRCYVHQYVQTGWR